MERRKHNPLTEIPKPSEYAVRVGYAVGDLVTYRSQVMLVSALVNFSVALYPGDVIGYCYVLPRNDWTRGQYLIVAVDEIDHPKFCVA